MRSKTIRSVISGSIIAACLAALLTDTVNDMAVPLPLEWVAAAMVWPAMYLGAPPTGRAKVLALSTGIPALLLFAGAELLMNAAVIDETALAILRTLSFVALSFSIAVLMFEFLDKRRPRSLRKASL